MSLKIPTYVITMMGEPFSEALAQETLESLGRFGEQGQKFPATHGNDVDLHWKEHELKQFKIGQKFKTLNQGLIGCLLSHLRLWKLCREQNEPFLILEHDAVFVDHIPNTTMLKHVGTVGKPSYGKFNKPAHIGWGPLTQKHYFGGAHAYIVKPSGAWHLMEMAQTNPAPTDVFLNKTNFPWLQEWSHWPVEVKDTFTTIQKTEGCLAKHNYYKETYVIENV
jgi:GR25 family glycosyltransferase involved in LPS biosynthesis